MRAYDFLKRIAFAVLGLEVCFAIAHLAWPHQDWGQGRSSYFRFGNDLTLATWLATAQLALAALLCVWAAVRERSRQPRPRGLWHWTIVGAGALALSFAELTRLPRRLDWFGLPRPDAHEQLMLFALLAAALGLGAWLLFERVRTDATSRRWALVSLTSWTLALLARFGNWMELGVLAEPVSAIAGLGFLVGSTSLAMTAAAFLVRDPEACLAPAKALDAFAPVERHRFVYAAVAGLAFIVIFLQLVLFRLLTTFGDYLTAHSILAIALIGIAVGGLLGHAFAARRPFRAAIGSSLLLPLSLLFAFGAVVTIEDRPLLLSALLAIPFACASLPITIALIRVPSHRVYGFDLMGAALGALALHSALVGFREEGSLFLLFAVGVAIAFAFVMAHPDRRFRRLTAPPLLGLSVLIAATAGIATQSESLNAVRAKIEQRYPDAELLFSRSSLVGRYDVARRDPGKSSLSSYENGRIIDTIRNEPPDSFRIDPRMPHTWHDNPSVLILGLSGDGVIKTAKSMSDDVTGIEINPVVAALQRGPLAQYNHDSYEDLDVAIMDARSFVESVDRKYDYITLMNAHSAKGGQGRAPSPEFLHTKEAAHSYLDHLTDRGALIVEEPTSRPNREVPVWKLVVTLRDALLERGNAAHRHFFIFQWRTKRNNYVQVLMSKSPLASDDIARLKAWLDEVDRLDEIEEIAGERMGPITTRTTLLYSPDEDLDTNYARILRGTADPEFYTANQLVASTDDRPFLFQVDAKHRETKTVLLQTVIAALLVLPLLMTLLRRRGVTLRQAARPASLVALTGMGYLLLEVVLMQRFSLFLGNPVIAFSSVLGTLLVFSGLGSLWSGRLGSRSTALVVGALVALLLFQAALFSTVLGPWVAWSLATKVAVTIACLAPMAFLLGVPFPWVLRSAAEQLGAPSTGLLFALNALASAVAAPLALALSTLFGLGAVIQIGVAIYAVVGVCILVERSRVLALGGMAVASAMVFLLPALPWIASTDGVTASVSAREKARVYALSYGRSSYRNSRIFHGGSSKDRSSFAWMYWLVQTGDRTILVDTGFEDPKLARKWNIDNYEPPTEKLAQLGIRPEDVDDIILTHAHWDHVGAVDRYPNARVWMQRAEYEGMAASVSGSRSRHGMNALDVERLAEIARQGRLHMLDGSHQLTPSVEMTRAGTHTAGSQYVTIETRDGAIVLAGDTTYLYRNNQSHVPTGCCSDPEADLEAIREMQRRAASPFYIIPGHDPRVFSWFPEISDGIVQIAVNAE